MEKTIKLIKELYDTEDGICGGYGHIVFDDGNIETHHIESCIDDCKQKAYSDNISEETRLASLTALESFLLLSEEERELVYESL